MRSDRPGFREGESLRRWLSQTALLATMSIPALFSPVRDGDTFTWMAACSETFHDVVRKMGAEIVIAVILK